MTTTEIISQAAERIEQHEADMALLSIDRNIAIRFGNTVEMIEAAQAREAAYTAEVRGILGR